jgi:hypothetical protein
MRRYFISIPTLAVTVIGFSALWFFGLLNQGEPNSFVFYFSRTCSAYAQRPKMTLYLYENKAPKFRFMLHEVEELGNRVAGKETCSRLFLHFPSGTSGLSHIVAAEDNKLIETAIGNLDGEKLTLVSKSEASNERCALPVICLDLSNVVGIEGSLPDRPSKISFSGWAAYFSTHEILGTSAPNEGKRDQTIFEIGLHRAYELTGQTTPQPVAFALLFGADNLDSWYRFDPQKWPYLQDNFVSVLFAYQSRLLTAIRDSTLFLLAAILGVAFQASVDAIVKRRKAKP